MFRFAIQGWIVAAAAQQSGSDSWAIAGGEERKQDDAVDRIGVDVALLLLGVVTARRGT